MVARTICMAVALMIASAVAQADQCSSGGECPSNDMPEDVVSLLQTKLQVFASKVRKYNQHLESLEGSTSSLVAERVEVDAPWPSSSETLFIVLSDSNHYLENLKWISNTWGKDLSSSQLLAIGDVANKNPTGMRVETTDCPAHQHGGICCKGGSAIITAHQEMEKQPNLKWAYIVEDDAYVRAEAMDKRLKLKGPVGEASRGTLIALGGCFSEASRCEGGVCGAGGIALSREALATMVGNNRSKYLSDHMRSCEICGLNRGDGAIGAQAHLHGVNIITHEPFAPDGMNWLMQVSFVETLTTHPEPLMYHPIRPHGSVEGKFKFLDQLFAKEQESVEDLHSGCCATYNGNTVCASDNISCHIDITAPAL